MAADGVVLAADASAIQAVPRCEGVASPGLRVWLDARKSVGQDLRYFWVQTKGPAVDLGPADAARASFIVPREARDLAFLLVVAGREGFDRKALDVPLVLHSRPSSSPAVVADAGDNQLGVVGHQVTLNGLRSTPRDRLAFRWIQVEGPKVRSKVEEGWIYAFTPDEAGLYRFLLVVAGDDAISEPAEVRVFVAPEAPSELGGRKSPRAPARKPSRTDQGASGHEEPVEEFARTAVNALDDGPDRAAEMATAFEGVAGRLQLYATYEDVLSEMSRRLEGALPEGEKGRADWERSLLDPLSGHILRALRAEGLDLSRESSVRKPLNDAQKARLAGMFQAIARGLRAATG